MNTEVNRLLDCRYPILMGGMQWISKAEFVAVVCNSGGFGFLSSSSFTSAEELQQEIKKTKTLTNKPFGVNISMLPDTQTGGIVESFLDVCISEKVKALETSGRNPKDLVQKAKDAGLIVLHKVTTARHAISAEKNGVDGIIAVGYEAAGHPGMSQVGSFVNLPLIINAVSLPVIAAGGVCDGKSMAAAILLGAKGILMGTRFLATKESPINQKCKQWILGASELDTLIIQRSIRNSMRCMNTNQAYKVLGLESTNVTFDELYPHIRGYIGRNAWETGEIDDAVLTVGQNIGLIKDIISVNELIENIVNDASKALIKSIDYFGIKLN